MPMLVGDIGGSRVRLALARGGRILPESLRRLERADFPGPGALLAQMLVPGLRLDAVCLAVAGPVQGARAELTNGGWRFDAAELMRLAGAARCLLLNDLAALGLAVAHGAAVDWLTAPPQGANSQRLVLGLGTGANICALRRAADGRILHLESEAGHAALPAPVAVALRDAIGPAADGFATVEALFSGPGLIHLHRAMGGDPLPAAAIPPHPAGALHARLLGRYMADLSLQFLPREGLILAGGVARGLVAAGLAPQIHAGLAEGGALPGLPLGLIADDAAALRGCLAALMAAG